MSDQPTPDRPLPYPDSGTTHTTIPDRTWVTVTGATGVTWYTTAPPAPPPPAPPPPAPRPSQPAGGGGRRRLGRLVAVLVLAAALVFSGVAIAQHFAGSGVSTTSLLQPVAPPGTARQQPSLGGGSNGSGAAADVNAIAAKVNPTIVNISVENKYASSGGAATGIVLTSDGYVLTNNHVVNGATDIEATDVGNGQTYSATVVGYDVTHDIALIKLENASGLATASIGDSSTLAVGDTVVGIGNAGGAGGQPAVVTGSVVALDRQIVAGDRAGGSAEQLSGLIQTDADIRSGDSGGPLVNADGAVIGVMTAASIANGGSSGYGHEYGSGGNEGYAVPIATAMQIVDQIRSGSASSTVHIGGTGFLGVQTVSGAQGSAPGYGDPYGYSDPNGGGSSGSSGGTNGSSSGATVTGLVSGSPAEKAGLAAGDVITAVDGEAVTSPSGLSDLIAAHHPGDTVTVAWADSSGAQRSASVVLAEGPPK